MRICTLLFFVFSSLAFAQGEAELKSSDLKKISKYTGEWIDAKIDNNSSKMSDAIMSLEEQVIKMAKSIKDRNPLSYVYDWEIALHQARKYATSGSTVKKGRLLDVDFARAPYSVWLPKKYNPKKSNYPCIVLLGDAAASLIESLPIEILDNMIVLAPDISSMSEDLALTIETAISIIIPVSEASKAYHLDRMRLFMVGTDELGSVIATQWGAVMPHLFAGVTSTTDVTDKVVGNKNLELVSNTVMESVNDAVTWCAAQARTNPYPLSFEFEIPFAQQSRVFWVHPIKSDSSEGQLANIKVSVDRDSNTISIDSTSVERVKLYLNDAIVNLDKPVVIVRNGIDYTYQPSRSVGTMLQVFASSLDGAVFPATIQEVDIPQVEETKE
jgi:hypothetical protein